MQVLPEGLRFGRRPDLLAAGPVDLKYSIACLWRAPEKAFLAAAEWSALASL